MISFYSQFNPQISPSRNKAHGEKSIMGSKIVHKWKAFLRNAFITYLLKYNQLKMKDNKPSCIQALKNLG